MTTKTYRYIKKPWNYRDLKTDEAARRLNQDLNDIVAGINEDKRIDSIPKPTGLTGTFSQTGFAALSWDDVDDDYRTFLDGAKIWRAPAASDASLIFGDNEAKTPLVNCIRTTKYMDHEVTSGLAYVYWVQWINIEGILSDPAGGITGTIT